MSVFDELSKTMTPEVARATERVGAAIAYIEARGGVDPLTARAQLHGLAQIAVAQNNSHVAGDKMAIIPDAVEWVMTAEDPVETVARAIAVVAGFTIRHLESEKDRTIIAAATYGLSIQCSMLADGRSGMAT